MMKLFKKKETADQSDIVYEKWQTSFSRFQNHRFEVQASDRYLSKIEHGSLLLRLKRRNLFAWIDNPLYRYEDFYLSAALSISENNGYSSVGLMFRKTDNLSYYYFLVSNKGYYRLDAVLNGSPSVLVDWTPFGDFDPRNFNLDILVEGGSIVLGINNEWVGEVYDDTLSAGGISFAGQNYNEKNTAEFLLNRVEIESRPGRLDRKSDRIGSREIDKDKRYVFAQSLIKTGSYSAALVELNRIIDTAPEPGVLMAAAECCMNIKQYLKAENYLNQVPEDQRSADYIIRKAGLMYLTNRFLELRDFLEHSFEKGEAAAAGLNLLGNAEFALGNWQKAAQNYVKAFELDDSIALFAVNAARALEKSGEADKASGFYGRAATLYFRNNEYEELEALLPFLEGLDSSKGETSAETMILKAKLLFHNEDFEAAYSIFDELVKSKKADSTVYYLKALIDYKNKKNSDASAGFIRAVELEPDYYLYNFKLAEFRFMTGGNYAEKLHKAIEAAPDDPWVMNLAGLAAEKEDDLNAAVNFFSRALETAPDEDQIRVNYSEALFLSGRVDDALEAADAERALLLNQRGNIFSRLNRYDDAVKEYEAAYALDRSNIDVALNLAAASIEADSYSRAEELLVRIIEQEENSGAYNLIGNLALLKGEYSRAEAAYRKSIELDPRFSEAVCNLADLLINRDRLNDADMLLSGFKGKNPGERFEKLKQTVFRKRMNIYSCSSCGTEWVVPRKIPPQPALKLRGEPPDDMPAGECSECGSYYCIGCAKEHLSDGKLMCLSCGIPLKLSEDWMRYLYHQKGY